MPQRASSEADTDEQFVVIALLSTRSYPPNVFEKVFEESGSRSYRRGQLPVRRLECEEPRISYVNGICRPHHAPQ
jgi:hypothetical protein